MLLELDGKEWRQDDSGVNHMFKIIIITLIIPSLVPTSRPVAAKKKWCLNQSLITQITLKGSQGPSVPWFWVKGLCLMSILLTFNFASAMLAKTTQSCDWSWCVHRGWVRRCLGADGGGDGLAHGPDRGLGVKGVHAADNAHSVEDNA